LYAAFCLAVAASATVNKTLAGFSFYTQVVLVNLEFV